LIYICINEGSNNATNNKKPQDMKNLVVCFHTTRGGQFYNAGHKEYRGQKTFSELTSELGGILFFIDDMIEDSSGDYVSCDDPTGLTGELDFDGQYDTWECKSIDECTDQELRLVIQDENYYKHPELQEALEELKDLV